VEPAPVPQAFAALPEGGAFIAIDTIIDDARRSNTFGLAMSLNMLVEFGREGAFDYTFQVSCRSWAEIWGWGGGRLGGAAA
jgi:hypothetical protein